jgi:hypothetical protein
MVREGSRGSNFSPLEAHFMERLDRLLRLRNEQAGKLNEGGLQLIDRAVYSTYQDAVELGVGAEAKELLHRLAIPS